MVFLSSKFRLGRHFQISYPHLVPSAGHQSFPVTSKSQIRDQMGPGEPIKIEWGNSKNNTYYKNDFIYEYQFLLF